MKKFEDDGYPKMWYGLSGPRDWVIVHNHILHTVDMPHGVNGFRYWRSPHSREHHALCRCGWRPDLGRHYRIRGTSGAKCISAEELERIEAS